MHIDIKNESLAAGVLRDLPAPPRSLESEAEEDGEQQHRCEYVGENGIQCRNTARPGSRYCGIQLIHGCRGPMTPDFDHVPKLTF